MTASLPAFVRVRPFVTACIALTLLLGVANYFLWSVREAAAAERANVSQRGEFIVRALENRPGVDAELGLLEDAIARIEESLVDEVSMEVNLGYFYRLEKATRVRLVSLNQLGSTAAPPGSPFKALPFSMRLSGSYRNNMAFLRALETGSRILRIRNCSFERGPAGANEFNVDLTVEVIAKAKA